ncbi:septum formation protein [Chitinivorax tropicus]|uniref:7-methyl-GTP pyrophosphatase n=1 Tax=Chitinivorax tropicus TaxID=714531 RepID=A0A840MGW9_9PROT|nr:Maf-like protein [Chitinivorax tropicus]MBB5017640.1 septum formation protein [Chitinivorax tropicus]
MNRPNLILASTSRYRQALLERLSIPFTVASPINVDETPLPDESPTHTALRLAEWKARSLSQQYPQALIIGSDQVATLDGEQIGKPHTHERAVAQLQKMRGRTVEFHSALCLLDTRTGHLQIADVVTQVRFRQLSDELIEAYLRKEQPYDCAGSAKSEGLGIIVIEAISGDDPNALIGLPLIRLIDMLNQVHYPIL